MKIVFLFGKSKKKNRKIESYKSEWQLLFVRLNIPEISEKQESYFSLKYIYFLFIINNY